VATEVDVHLHSVALGRVFRTPAPNGERIAFRYAESWLSEPDRFAIDPELFLDSRTTVPARAGLFGAFADSAPDRWGRQLMQRKERATAEAERRTVRSLSEMDYVLGVSDRSRPGALRFTTGGAYLAEADDVPPLVQLGALLRAAERIGSDDATAEDLALILAPGSSLGGARPKASVLDQSGQLSIAKFPRQGDDYSVERWEWIALELARSAGIRTATSQLVDVVGQPVLLSRRFDREARARIHFASALTLLGLAPGDRSSYPEIAEVLQREGARPKQDSEELFRRMVFNVCIANTDDHLRNHGFLHERSGWVLSPAYDLNPVPSDVRPRILTTNVTPDDATGSLDAARDAATYFGIDSRRAETVIQEVTRATATWERVARAAGASRAECRRMQSAFLVG
jgi:serine/threonine-protein kinase HipA